MDVDRAATTVLTALLAAFALGALLSPPDPFSQLYWTAGALPVTLLASYVLVYRGWTGRLASRLA